MTALATQTYTVLGLASDVDDTDLFIAAVLLGPVTDQIEPLSTSEEHFTRWAEEIDAPDPDTAAALAYERCGITVPRPRPGETAGDYMQRVLKDSGIASYEDGHASAGCFWIVVVTPGGGEIWINGLDEQENLLHYPAAAHCGWLVCSYPEPGDTSIFSVLHEGGSTDLAADTADALKAIRAELEAQAATRPT
ncbi:hypothetical protein GCM10017744_103370 [Streptomyces antimycoticus]|uniref:Uncharacterized protein n=1 Tax=Streptomyces antimycoticus TaxID=68175 RepID=A0A4D4KJP5_9ACTN|nr:hypothetical protein [Streptomyces antimycoticus]GDY49371.1 hypothetical protein SANT12839_102530 [Streptomyces antimycoticus]